MSAERISFSIGRGEEKIVLHLKMLSLAEEAEFLKRFADIADLGASTKAEKEYQILVDSLADWSVASPQKYEKEELVSLFTDESTPADAVHKYFETRTVVKERLANAAVIAFRNALQPEVSFL